MRTVFFFAFSLSLKNVSIHLENMIYWPGSSERFISKRYVPLIRTKNCTPYDLDIVLGNIVMFFANILINCPSLFLTVSITPGP